MTVKGLRLPDGFARLCQEIRGGKTVPHWLLKGEAFEVGVDAYGNHLANPDVEFLTSAEAIEERTDSLWQEFGREGRFLAGPEDASSPGFVEVTSAKKFVWFGTVASGEPFCFDFGEDPQRPSIITWNDAYWQRVAPDFETFISLFVPWTGEEDERRFGGPSPAPAVTKVPRAESRRCTRATLEATDLARAGKAAEGHAHLLSGLQRAEELRDSGEPWGAQLVTSYREALDTYSRFLRRPVM